MKRLYKSMRHALCGLAYVVRHERNFQIELAIAFMVFIGIFFLHVSQVDFIFIIFLIFFVLILEILNTACERIVDMLKPRVHPYARLVKDMMAGVVFFASFFAVIIGAYLMSPYILRFFV